MSNKKYQNPAPEQKQPDSSGGARGRRDFGDNSYLLTKLPQGPGYTETTSGSATTYTPTQGANGKRLYFFFGYRVAQPGMTYSKEEAKALKTDGKMRAKETANLQDDIREGVEGGFTVVYDTAGTRDAFLTAVADASTYGIYWSGHGVGGNIVTSDGDTLQPTDIDPARVGGNCQYLIFAACESGQKEVEWQTAMGAQCAFQGWVKTTRPTQTNDFTSTVPMDDLNGHNGTHPNLELADYIQQATEAAKH